MASADARFMRIGLTIVVLLVSCSGDVAVTVGPGSNSAVSPSISAPPPTSAASVSSTSPTKGPPTPIPLPSFADVAAAGNSVVWTLVAGDHLFRSLDRGETWEERIIPAARVAKIAFVDDSFGWALVVGSPATGCMAQSFVVWQTTDGAATWQVRYENQLDSVFASGCKSSLAFVDQQHGYVSLSGRDVAPAILHSMDGGATWSLSKRLPDPPGFRFEPSVSTLAPGAVADFGSSLFVFARSQIAGEARGHVYRSTDRASTWSHVVGTPMPSEVVFLTPTRWLQIGTPSSWFETTDGGASWHSFATNYTQAAGVAPQIVFGDAKTGYATVRGAIQRTTDGGAHWSYIRTPGTQSVP